MGRSLTSFRQVVTYFKRNFYRKKQKLRKIGLELEFPVTDSSGKAITWRKTKKIFKSLKKKGWEELKDQGTNEIIALKCPPYKNSRGDYGYKQDVIGTDVGACTIELSLSPDDNLCKLQEHAKVRIDQIVKAAKQEKCKILGLGIQPISYPNKNLLAPKGRYVFFEEDSLNRLIPQKFGVDLHIFAITAANQVHLDVNLSEAIVAVNTFNKLASLFTAVTANASFWNNRIDPQWKDMREIAWDFGWTNRIEQTGIPKEFKNFPDYVETLCNFRPLMIKRESEFLKVRNEGTFRDFILSSRKYKVKDAKGNFRLIEPNISDIELHSGFAWWEARLAPSHGTLEVRPCGAQPQDATLSVAAFALGILENLKEAEKLSCKLSRHECIKLRFEALRNGLGAKLSDGRSILPLVNKLMDISEKGLRKRNLSEERFLEPLKIRIRKKKTPADEMCEIVEQKGIKKALDYFEIK